MWLRAGFGRRMREERWQAAHYRLLGWILERVYRTGRWTFRLRVVGSGDGEPIRRDRPLLVLCRHAGPGDSVLLVRTLVSLAHLRPRIVLKDALQLDPTVDLLLNRLPNRFITPHPDVADDVTAAIATLAAGCGPGDAVVIFPEGGNFSEGRRSRAIERLRGLGHADEAAKAEAMRNLMAPRPGGTLAAIAAAPDADVLLVAHEGLEDLDSVADLWRGLPMDDVVEVKWWLVESDELPRRPRSRRPGRLALRLVDPPRHLDNHPPPAAGVLPEVDGPYCATASGGRPGRRLPRAGERLDRARIPERTHRHLDQRNREGVVLPQLVYPLAGHAQHLADLAGTDQFRKRRLAGPPLLLRLGDRLDSDQRTAEHRLRINAVQHLPAQLDRAARVRARQIQRHGHSMLTGQRSDGDLGRTLVEGGFHGLEPGLVRSRVVGERDRPVPARALVHYSAPFLRCARCSRLLGGGTWRPARFNACCNSTIRRQERPGVAGYLTT